jgi:hypothetical protein
VRVAQELFLFASEFHASNYVQERAVPRTALPEIPSQNRPYKAIVYLWLDGGADTWNLLVPVTYRGPRPTSQTVVNNHQQHILFSPPANCHTLLCTQLYDT